MGGKTYFSIVAGVHHSVPVHFIVAHVHRILVIRLGAIIAPEAQVNAGKVIGVFQINPVSKGHFGGCAAGLCYWFEIGAAVAAHLCIKIISVVCHCNSMFRVLFLRI